MLTVGNGTVNYSQPLIDDPPRRIKGYPANTVASFSCDAGYVLSGHSSIMCNPDGQPWNQSPPRCNLGIAQYCFLYINTWSLRANKNSVTMSKCETWFY